MRVLTAVAERLVRLRWAREAVREEADLGAFRRRPSPKLLLGVGLIGLSMLMGWPLVSLLGIMAVYLGEPLVGVVGGPAAYGVSWVIWWLGVLIAGRESAKYPMLFLHWATRRYLEKHLGDELPHLLERFDEEDGEQGQGEAEEE